LLTLAPCFFCLQVAAAAAEVGKEGYDVYVQNEEVRLEKGVRKHTLSVFVADESGLINRVAGVFARRNANIESLAVGLTVDQALFTIVATGTDADVANLCKQLAKLVNVRYVEDITGSPHVERELVLLKLYAPPGPARTEVMQIAEIFRAHAVDVSDKGLVLSVTGDPGKVVAFQKVLTKFGIVELVRTGRIALKRGEQLFDDDKAWGSTSARGSSTNHDTAAKPAVAQEVGQTGVYASSPNGSEGVWKVQNILDAAYSGDKIFYDPYTLSIVVQDVPGVLNQVTGVVARRGYNVQSLAVGNCETEGMSRITMVVPGDAGSIDNLNKQLKKLVYVSEVEKAFLLLCLLMFFQPSASFLLTD
jgi:acetolactate synthase I/III small subunit